MPPLPPPPPAPDRCPGCGTANGCAIAAGDDIGDCWCLRRGGEPLPVAAASCYCPACLDRLARERMEGGA